VSIPARDEKLAGHVLQELGFSVNRAGEGLVGSASVVPQMWTTGTRALRTSILAVWGDTLTGLLAMDVVRPRVPVTLQLEVQVHRPLVNVTAVRAQGRRVKAGRSVVVSAVDFTDQAGRPIAIATGIFMVNADPSMLMPDLDIISRMGNATGSLRTPFAARVNCTRESDGVAFLQRTPDGLNASGTVNGGLLALVVEEAALSAQEPGASLASLTMRYLRPVRLGPAIATAIASNGVGEISVVDHGRDDALSVLATTRSFPPAPVPT
jgi:acyl-coenzyme A thioesterase PaaI-like protein